MNLTLFVVTSSSLNTSAKHYFPKYSQSYGNRNFLKTEAFPFGELKNLASQFLSVYVLSLLQTIFPSCVLALPPLQLRCACDTELMPSPVLILYSFLAPSAATANYNDLCPLPRFLKKNCNKVLIRSWGHAWSHLLWLHIGTM